MLFENSKRCNFEGNRDIKKIHGEVVSPLVVSVVNPLEYLCQFPLSVFLFLDITFMKTSINGVEVEIIANTIVSRF